ncbi:hypothetical protein HXT30_01035 [Gardnerella sp. DNF00571G]|uniref:hypothetical protein n=1 Tax=Gardnerella sp. DNF00571G TaxID=2749052 RepID=UPI003BB154CB
MMNKKAIAAFAAGATLLAGFAMATPAFAAETPAPTKAQLVQAAKDAWTNYAAAKAVFDKMTKPADKDKPQKPAGIDDYIKQENGVDVLNTEKTTGVDTKLLAKATEYVNNLATYNKKVKDYNDQEQKVKDLSAAYLTAKAAAEGHADDPSEDDAKDAAIADVMNAKGTLDRFRVKKNKLYSEVKKKYRALKDAEANEKSAQKALDAANEELKDFNDSGVEDSARLNKLELKVSRAEAKHDAAKKALGKASHDYDEVHNKYTYEVLPAFKAAKKTYDDAYDAAIRLGVDPAKLPLVSTAEDPLENDFLGDPGTAAEVLSGKTPAQPGANGAAAGANGAAGKAGANGAAAGAKAEVENKKDRDKRGNTHTGTGVGVTLTALAATMLAGMGAAVRKARH